MVKQYAVIYRINSRDTCAFLVRELSVRYCHDGRRLCGNPLFGRQSAYRYEDGSIDANFNYQVDPGEKKVCCEVSDFSTYVFYENPS